jgi:hypothetical protein
MLPAAYAWLLWCLLLTLLLLSLSLLPLLSLLLHRSCATYVSPTEAGTGAEQHRLHPGIHGLAIIYLKPCGLNPRP